MGSMIQGHELSLHCTPTYIPHTTSEFLGQVSMIGNVSERLMKLDEYITRLEDEMRKIDAFKRELPLCMVLLNDAILAVKEEAKQCKKSNAEPVLAEFIPLKKSCDEEDDKKVEIRKENDSREKMNWLSSVQLWNSSNDCQDSNLDLSNSNNEQNLKPELGKRTNEGVNHLVSNNPFKSCKSQSTGIAFVPFKGYTSFPITTVRKEKAEELSRLPGLSLQTLGIKNTRDGPSGLRTKSSDSGTGSASAANGQSSVCSGSKSQQHQTTRKQRRCWSPELHRRFVEALEQLGGTQVATPKQIRELMQVDGLTNDEVKSHLQKYRLHTRRTPATSAPTTNHTGVLLEGLWPSQDHHHRYGDSSKQSNSQSGSPQGPLQFGRTSQGSLTGGDSMEDEDDEKSESHSWKSQVHSYEKNHV